MKEKFAQASASELVILAIYSLEKAKPRSVGFTPDEIIKHISKKYKVTYKKAEPPVQAALFKALTFGILLQKNGRFKLEKIPEPISNSKKTPKKKNNKTASRLVESIAKKRKNQTKRSPIGFDDKVKPLTYHKGETSRKDCYSLARRRISSVKSSDDDSDGQSENDGYIKTISEGLLFI